MQRPTARNTTMESNVWRVYLHNYSGKNYNVGLFWNTDLAKRVALSLSKLSYGKEFTVVSYTKECVRLTKMRKGWAEVHRKTPLIDYVRDQVLSKEEYGDIPSHWKEAPIPTQSRAKERPLKKQRTESPPEDAAKVLESLKEAPAEKTSTIEGVISELGSKNTDEESSSPKIATQGRETTVEK